MPTYTSYFNLAKPTVNDPVDADQWGGLLNSDIDAIDGLLRGVTSAKSASFTVQTTEFGQIYLCNATSAAIIATLPSAATAGNGFKVAFKKTDSSANAVTLTPNGADTIDGATTYALSSQYSSIIITSDGSNWHIVANNTNKFLHIQDQKPSGTAGGTFTSGAWQTRTLNTKVYDTIGSTLSSNQFTLPQGTYIVTAYLPTLNTFTSQGRMQNITDATTSLLGQSAVTGNTAGGVAIINGVVTLNSTKTFEIQHRCATTVTTNGFGYPSSWGTEVYSEVKIYKVL